MVRELRQARGLRQMDVADRAGVVCETVSRLERGELEGMTVGTLRALSRALRMPPIVSLGWRHPEIDQLRDKRHAAMVEAVVAELQGKGWEAAPEHSFSHFGERGPVDTLGWHAESRTLLVVEVKTRIWDVQDTLSTLDRKRRLMPVLASRDRGWNAASVGVLLVLPKGARTDIWSNVTRLHFERSSRSAKLKSGTGSGVRPEVFTGSGSCRFPTIPGLDKGESGYG
jgi:transcriptional regulator with XRE-family HTH domain